MTIAFQTDAISPHMVPLAEALGACIGFDNFRYIYVQELSLGRIKLGWKDVHEPWMFNGTDCSEEKYWWMRECDVLVTGERTSDVLSIFEERESSGQMSFYMSERWFKPPFGLLRFLKPGFFRMAQRMAHLIRKGSGFFYLPIGVHAAEDMARLVGLFSWDWKCLFKSPKIELEKSPCGLVKGPVGYGLEKMFLWGYFVATGDCEKRQLHNPIKCLWIGRMLKLKRVKDIIKALRIANKERPIELTLVGTGPEEANLKKMAVGLPVSFVPPVSIDQVRELMHQHDVYVFPSNGYDGWGAVVSEALSEGMRVVGSVAPGAPITLLPDECLYKEGDIKKLAKLLLSEVPWVGVGWWTPEKAANSLINLIQQKRKCGI